MKKIEKMKGLATGNERINWGLLMFVDAGWEAVT